MIFEEEIDRAWLESMQMYVYTRRREGGKFWWIFKSGFVMSASVIQQLDCPCAVGVCVGRERG